MKTPKEKIQKYPPYGHRKEGKTMTKQQIASMIDHTLLKATATPNQIRELCAVARELGTASVCVNPCHIPQTFLDWKSSSTR